MNVLEALLEYDGKQTATLERFVATNEPTSDLLRQLVELSASTEPNVANGVTWLLRAYLDAGATLSPELIRDFVDRLSEIDDQWARLHAYRIIGLVEIGEADADRVVSFLNDGIAGARPFLRAWATDALYRVAAQHPRFETEADAALRKALEDPAPSVRARARRIVEDS